MVSEIYGSKPILLRVSKWLGELVSSKQDYTVVGCDGSTRKDLKKQEMLN